ncbi:hypothetical protein [Streptococcus canis]|nr:hypothetical protein [Streptococcus canis]
MAMLDYLIYMVSRLLAVNPMLVIVSAGIISYGFWRFLKRGWPILTNVWRYRKQFFKRCRRSLYDLRSTLSQLRKDKPSHLAKSFGRC